MAERAQITITGVVQGVGFRPYVYTLATSLGIRGHVTNTAQGVLIEAQGDRLAEFLDRLPKEAPPLSRICGIEVLPVPASRADLFEILPSRDAPRAFTLLSPDISICPDCLKELFDPRDRRFHYPFINCINCGPRYSITRKVPYDRPNTTMSAFVMCPDCDREYHDPRDRRFHAQPNACAECGPKVEFRMGNAECGTTGSEAMRECVAALRVGKIVAIKGLGGFHLACDAANDDSVGRLRERKRKSNKPFAVMAASIDHVRDFCEVSDQESSLLLSSRRPIVLLKKKEGSDAILSDAVSPGNSHIGCMLPYTPLHYLLFNPVGGEDGGRPVFKALVMTSGNLSEEPIVRDNDEALRKLGGTADAFLLHDRDIFMRVDDSVLRMRSAECGVRNEERETDGSSQTTMLFLRRSRSYAPDPIPLRDEGPEVLGCGADLKNTFTLTKGAYAIPSQHIGDMENYETLRFYEEVLENLKQVYRADPVAIVHDLHPGYLSTQWAKGELRIVDCGLRNDIKVIPLQHHYAHIGSVMAEHGLQGPVIGVALDGTGYGRDGNLWGGEFLVADIHGFTRAGQFAYVPLPGGEAAIREPWRTAAGMLFKTAGTEADDLLAKIGFFAKYGKEKLDQVRKVSGIRDVSPLSSGAGRLFDAVSAMLGLCDRNTFEGEAAMALESMVIGGNDGKYGVVFNEANQYTVLDFSPTIRSVLDDLAASTDLRLVATKFHNTIADALSVVVGNIHKRTGIREVALSGGTFQNRYLVSRTVELLEGKGLTVHLNRAMPPNDACISLGQAYIVRERLKKECMECGKRNEP